MFAFDESNETYENIEWALSSLRHRGIVAYCAKGTGLGDFEVTKKLIETAGGKLIQDGPQEYAVFEIGGGICWLHGKIPLNLSYAGPDVNVRDKIKSWIDALTPVGSEKGSFYLLARGMSGLGLTEAGKISGEIERQNYMPETVKKMDHAIACLTSNNPCGRLVLLDGPPGTGKTYFIRGLSSTIEAMFVLVSPALVSELSGPEVAPVLIQQREMQEENETGPIILILEDADHALINRAKGDLSRLSEVLNMGDGLLGNLIDLRVIVTTNSSYTDLDPAVTRAGRMCSHINFSSLNKERSKSVYQRLVGNKTEIKESMTLGDIYRLARNDGWMPSTGNSVSQGNYQ